MSDIRKLVVRVIEARAANEVVRSLHYSGKVANSSQIHFGVFKNDRLIGVAQFGSSIDKPRMGQSLGIGMNEYLELNRLVIHDEAGKNAESRVLGICLRMIRRSYPFLKCIVSFADACQCGDGTIYRASGFRLHSYKKNSSILELDTKTLKYVRKYLPRAVKITAKRSLDDVITSDGKYLSSKVMAMGAKPLIGYQMKYIYYFDKELEKKHPHIEFDKIPNNVKMYKGIKRAEHENNAPVYQTGEGGATPTDTLQSPNNNGNNYTR